MAWEAQRQRYRFEFQTTQSAFQRRRQGTTAASSIQAPTPPFQPNFLHDIESMFWTVLWVLLHYTDEAHPPANPYAQRFELTEAFPTWMYLEVDDVVRLDRRQDDDETYRGLSDTHKGAFYVISPFSTGLVASYTQAEASYPKLRVDVGDELLEAHLWEDYIISRRSIGEL